MLLWTELLNYLWLDSWIELILAVRMFLLCFKERMHLFVKLVDGVWVEWLNFLFDVMIHVHFIKLVIGILVRVVLAAQLHRLSNRFWHECLWLIMNFAWALGSHQMARVTYLYITPTVLHVNHEVEDKEGRHVKKSCWKGYVSMEGHMPKWYILGSSIIFFNSRYLLKDWGVDRTTKAI